MARVKKPKAPVESPRLPNAFDAGLLQREAVKSRSRPSGLYAWDYDALRSARDQQVRGLFRRPAELARSLKTDAAIYATLLNRLAPHRGLPRQITTKRKLSELGRAILDECSATFAVETSTSLPLGVIADDLEKLVLHGLSVSQIYWAPREDGSRLDAFVEAWPQGALERDPTTYELFALTETGRVKVVHGDGRWLVHSAFSDRPEQWGAVVPLALLWPDRAFSVRDRSRNSESHGDDKWLGEMPEGVPIDSPQGQALLEQMEMLYEARRAMIRPYGSKVERSEAMSQNWQIFKEIIDADSRDIQRILLGQDGTMSNSGGNYIKSWGLFGVRNDIVEGDLTTLGSTYSTGLLRPWSLVNFGRWDRLRFEWVMPDADQDARFESNGKRIDAFNKACREMRENGFVLDQPAVERLARSFGIDAPTLAEVSSTPTARVDEARRSQGLPPIGDERGELMIEELAKQAAADASAAAAESERAAASIVTPRAPLRAAGA